MIINKLKSNQKIRNSALILTSLLLFCVYEFLVSCYLVDVTKPILLSRSFHFILFFSIFYIIKNSKTVLGYKLTEILATSILFIFSILTASIIKYIISYLIGEINNIPEILYFLGDDFVSLINNRYFGYSSYFIVSLGILRIFLMDKLLKLLKFFTLLEGEDLIKCKYCNE